MSDRAIRAFKAVVRELLAPDASDAAPVWQYWVPWEYAVSEATDTTFTGRATSSRCPHPDLVRVPLRPGVAGTLIKPAVGSVCSVVFLNGDPSRPFVVGWDQATPETVTQDTSLVQTFSPSTTRMQITATGVEVGSGIPPAQAVALAPAVSSFATAAVTMAAPVAAAFTALAAFAADVGTQVPATAGTATAAVTACTAAAAAATAFATAVSALIGPFPTGFTSTRLRTQ